LPRPVTPLSAWAAARPGSTARTSWSARAAGTPVPVLRTTAAAEASWPTRASVEPTGLHRLPRGRRNRAAVVAEQGATYSKLFTLTNSAGDLIDLTGYTARLQVREKYSSEVKLLDLTTENGGITLGESPLDPVADIEVVKLTRFEYEEGTTQSNGKVLGPVAPELVLPILHQRYDDPSGEGIEIAVA